MSQNVTPVGPLAAKVIHNVKERKTARATEPTRPSGNVVCWFDGEAEAVGVFWLNETTGKKIKLELDPTKLPPSGKISAWLCPSKKKKE